MRPSRLLLLMSLLGLAVCDEKKLVTPLEPKAEAAASIVARSRGARDTERVIVRLRDRNEQPVVAQLAASTGGRVHRTYRRFPLLALEVNANALAALQRSPNVVAIMEDKLSAPTLDNSIPVIGADDVHDLGWTGLEHSIVIMDTGIDRDHPFVFGRVVWEACFSSDGGDDVSLCPNGEEEQIGTGAASINVPECQVPEGNMCEHGMHVAGIAAGKGHNVIGAPEAGVAPGATIIAIQVFTQILDEDDCENSRRGIAPCILSYDSDQIAALEHVIEDLGAGSAIAAVNMSLGGGENDDPCDDDGRAGAINVMHDYGNIAVTVSAGNEGYDDAIAAPACVSKAVAVGSTDNSDNVMNNRGPLLDLFAPGVGIISSVAGGDYGSKGGTSMAAPHVAGAFAVLRQAEPNMPVDQLLNLLRTTGVPVSYSSDGSTVTTPRIDLAAALRATTNPPVLTIAEITVSVNEGSTANNAGTFSDPNGDPVTLKASVGTVVAGAGGAWSWNWPTVDGPDDSQPVRIIATDNRGAADTVDFLLAVVNVAPDVSVGLDASITSNDFFTVNGLFADPGVEDDPWTPYIDWGDGQSTLLPAVHVQGGPISASHQYCAVGSYTVRLTVSDKELSHGSDSLTLTVNYLGVSIDITPGGEPNVISLSNRGLLPVALLSSATFNAPQSVNVSTVTLGNGTGTETSVVQRQNSNYYAEIEDANGDGLLDIVFRFSVPKLVANGDLTFATTQLFLRGTKTDGCTSFQGAGSVQPVQ